MNNAKKIDILSQNEFYETNFNGLKHVAIDIKSKTFENCQFTNANFSEVKFLSCKFIDCEFNSCNLSGAEFLSTSFSEVIFDDSKLIGINWTKVKWPLIKLTSALKFYKSNLSHSSFYELDLKELVIEECKAHDVDFRGGDFSNSSFILTDFERSMFMRTKLHSADFTDATNYNIDPNENDIRKAKFTMPDVINLLHSFDIEIQGA